MNVIVFTCVLFLIGFVTGAVLFDPNRAIKPEILNTPPTQVYIGTTP